MWKHMKLPSSLKVKSERGEILKGIRKGKIGRVSRMHRSEVYARMHVKG